MKRITFFTYNAYLGGGTERVMIMIANELAKKYEVDIISVQKAEMKAFYSISEKINVIDLGFEHTEPLKVLYKPLSLLIRNKLRNYKTDVFICVGMRYVPISIFMKEKTKYIAWEHYNSFVNKPHSVGEVGRKLAIEQADKIVVLTKKDKENYIKTLMAPEDKMVQIYNPNDNKIVSEVYDINSKLIISAGRFTEQKGYDYLVDVAAKVFAKHPDWQWHIYGEGPCKPDIEKKILENYLEKHVLLKGISKNLYEKYKNYSMYGMTSRFEGYPMVNIEAHSAKLPIVSFNCPCGPDEIIINGENGYIVDCFDIDAMAEKINYLIEHPEERQRMSDNTSLDKEKLEMENIIREWEKIF